MGRLTVQNFSITSPAENDTFRVQGPSVSLGLVVKGTGYGYDPDKEFPESIKVIVSVPGEGSVRTTSKKTNDIKWIWSASFTITSPGRKTITAGSGTASSTRHINVELIPDDNQPPKLTIIKPREGEEFRGPGPSYSVRIEGTAEDQSTIRAVQYRVGTSGTYHDVVKDSGGANTWKWHRDISGLSLGTHSIHIQAIDQYGNTSHQSRTTKFVDTGAPNINITNPKTSPHKITWLAGGASIQVAGTASDPTTGVASVQWRQDGGPWNDATKISGAWSNWRFTANNLDPGLHDIDVLATDGAKNRNTAAVQIVVAVPFEEDIGYAAYLKDLMTFTRMRVRTISDSTPTEKIEKSRLSNAQ